jgi:aryl-alcohol dehydrogenase-like predicted oxidoreductase
MQCRTLGRTGLRVSAISLGTVELGLDYGIAAPGERLKPDEHDATTFLNFALDSGVNLIDTARGYGESERIVGQALAARRAEFTLLSKIRSGPAAQVREHVRESLTSLRTNVIDIMMIHCLAGEISPDSETVETLLDLRKAGDIRFIGASVYGNAAATACIECGSFDCLEIAYSVLDRRPEESVFPMADRANIGIIARSVLLKGALSERYRFLPDQLQSLKACVQKLSTIAGSVSGLPEMAYRYVLATEPPNSVLVGTASRAELAACIGYTASSALPCAQLEAIRSVNPDDERWLNPGNWPGDNFPKPAKPWSMELQRSGK